MITTITYLSPTAKTYAIEDCHGNSLVDGVLASEIATTGQELANEYGQVVAYNEAGHENAPPVFLFDSEINDDD